MSVNSSDLFNKLYTKFDLDAKDIITRETTTGRLTESGQPRVALRNIVLPLVKTADNQLDPQSQVKLCTCFAVDFVTVQEYDLALECFKMALDRCDTIKDEFNATKNRVEAMQNIVSSSVAILDEAKYCRISPMSVSKLLVCLQDLRKALDEVFFLPSKSQEELAWAILNSCKLIMEVGQPLIWYSCGKYVAETIVFAATAMEAVINLCTVRHLKFRMKMYAAVFYGVLTMGSLDEADGIYEHALRQAKELRAREEIDPPVPEPSLRTMEEADIDLAVMKLVLDFWRDPDSVGFTAAHLENYYKPKITVAHKQSFADRCISECIRVHLLASGNTNEPFRKRSSCILKGVVKLLEPYKVEDRDPETPLSPRNQGVVELFSTQVLLEVAILALFEVYEGVATEELLVKVFSVAKEAVLNAERLDSTESPPVQLSDDLSQSNLSLLQQITKLVALEALSSQRAVVCSEIVVALESLLYSSVAHRKKAFIRKVCIFLWSRFIYASAQTALSSFDSTQSLALIEEITPAVCVAVKALDIVLWDDVVLVGSMAQLAGNLLWITGDHRGAISLLRQALENVDQHRAARVDLSLHMPEDVRDVLALQRASVTTRSEEQDWFHSTKRLGAHAFAGYGIFGLSSSADRSDQAVAELQTELASLYFRYELEHAISSRRKRLVIKEATCKLELVKEKAEVRNNKAKVKIAAPTIDKKAVTKSLMVTQTMLSSEETDCEKLAVLPSLRSFCVKNSYYSCLLLMEMSRVDTDEDRRFEYLKQALSLIEESEGREEMLKESFKNLIVMTHNKRTYPLLLARSHRYLYVVPVGMRKQKTAAYYRVFAKEKGSGTDVSIYNDDIAGCEKRVSVMSLRGLKDTIVRVGPLRRGELYMVGCVAFTADDKPVGGVSPTSPIIEAVNPLPTILLWSLLNQTAGEVLSQTTRLSREASLRVCNRYFLTTPTVPPLVVGKGVNLFLYTEPALCTLAVQQSTPLLLYNFIRSFIAYEKLTAAKRNLESDSANWVLRKPSQVSYMNSLQRTATVTALSVAVGNHDLTLQCVKLGYSQAIDMIRYDVIHLAFNLQNPLTVLVLGMQSILKRNWRILEHKLYTKLISHLVKVSALNRNVTPVISVLNQLYPESLDKDLVGTSLPPKELLHHYLALLSVVKDHLSLAHLAPMMQQFNALHVALTQEAYHAGEKSDVGFLWKMSETQRVLKLQGTAADFAQPAEKPTPDREQLDNWIINEKPEQMSDLLQVIHLLGKEVLASEKPVLWHKILTRLPVYGEYLSPELQAAHVKWGLQLLLPVSNLKEKPLSPRAAAAAAKKPPAKGKGAAAEVPDVPPEDPCKVPERFLTPTSEEVQRQWFYLAQILYTSAAACCEPDAVRVNAFPSSQLGPNIPVDPASASAGDSAAPPSAAEGGDVAQHTEGSAVPAVDHSHAAAGGGVLHGHVLSRAEYVKYLGASIDLFSQAHSSSSAVLAAVRLWNFIGCDWIDPSQFSKEFQSSTETLHHTCWALVHLLESLTYCGIEVVDVGELTIGKPLETSAALTGSGGAGATAVMEGGTVAWNTQALGSMAGSVGSAGIGLEGRSATGLTVREVKESMLLVKDLIVFLLKVKWLHKDYAEVVKIGVRIFLLLSSNCPEYCKSFGDHCMPLIVHAQEMLVSNAKAFLDARQKDLDDFIFNYEEAQKKKRKKKLRIAKTEKDEEELIFDAECAVLQSKIDEARAKFEKCEKDLATVQAQQKRFDALYSPGSQMFDKVKRATAKFLTELRTEFGQEVDFRSLVDNEGVQMKLTALLKAYRPVVSFLREKKDKLVLIEALKEQADLLLAFGRLPELRASLHDLIDGLFNTIDSCANWTTVSASAVESLEPELVPGIIPAIVALGKLSRYCVPTDLDAKSNYCRMAAELCRIPFFESYGHPQTTVGFAAYVCYDLGGVHGLTLNAEALSAQGLSVALEEVVTVLLAERYFVACFPVVVLLEHLYSHFLKNPSFWLKARLMRIKALIGSHHFAEAASMIAAIKSSIKGIYQQNFSDPLRVQTSGETATLANFETSLNGLNFYGVVPFLNNCPPDEEKNNTKALEWIKAFPADFEAFAKAFQLKLPPPVLTEEQKAALAAQKAEAEAAELAKKAKAAKGKPAAAPTEEAPVHENSVPIFNEVQVSDVYTTCGLFLLELAMLDSQSTAKHSPTLQKLGTSGTELLNKSISTLYASATLDNIRTPAWIDLNGTCQLMVCRYKLFRRKLKESRAMLLKYVEFMKSSVFNSLNGDSRYLMSQQWFATHDMLSTIATRQARHGDGIAQASKSATEASMLFCGYWLRTFLVQRASMEFKLGNVNKALTDVDAALGLFSVNHVEDLLYVRCLSLKASIIREKALYATKQAISAAAFVECILILRAAKEVSERLALHNGAFPSDANVVYGRSDTAVSTHHKIAPILNNFTTRHNNEPELTLKATLEKKRLEQMGSKVPASASDEAATAVDAGAAASDELRLGPVDFTETVFTLSEYANIYLPEVRALVNASTALCAVLDDFRLSGAVDSIKNPPPELDLKSFQSKAVLKEEEYLSESALKLMRQCIYTSPTARVSLLSIVGKVRVALTAAHAAETAGLLVTDALFQPFKAALDIAVKSIHPWELIRSLCLQMVEAYGDGALDFGDENSNRMKYAVTYMLGAVKSGVQYAALTKNATGISDDPTFTATPPSEELLSLMVNTTSSSATPPKVEASEAAAAPAAGGKAPAKPVKGAPAAAPTGAGPVGRDALFLLSAVLRETDPLWKDTHDHDISGDLHNLLKKTYTLYGQKCSLDKAPDVKDTATVVPGCTSTLWFPIKTPSDFATTLAKANNGLDYSKTGLYSHVAVFFLLGDRKATGAAAAAPAAPAGKAPPGGAPATASTNSVNPVLTRLVLSRVDVAYIEKRLRDVRDRYIDAETKKFPKTFLKCNQELGEILCLLVGLLKTGLIIIRKEEDENTAATALLENGSAEAQAPKTKCTYALSETPTAGGGYTMTLSLTSNGKVTSTVVLPVTEGLILNLATLFSTDRDTDSLSDGDALGLIRSALGYVEK